MYSQCDSVRALRGDTLQVVLDNCADMAKGNFRSQKEKKKPKKDKLGK